MSTLVTRTVQTPDGSPVSFPNGIKIGTALLGTPLKQNVNGTDLFPRLCELLQADFAAYRLSDQHNQAWFQKNLPFYREQRTAEIDSIRSGRSARVGFHENTLYKQAVDVLASQRGKALMAMGEAVAARLYQPDMIPLNNISHCY